MKPRFPLYLWIIVQLHVAALCFLLPWTADHLLLLWPVALAISTLVSAITFFFLACAATSEYYDHLSLWEFEQRRINPLAFHIHD